MVSDLLKMKETTQYSKLGGLVQGGMYCSTPIL